MSNPRETDIENAISHLKMTNGRTTMNKFINFMIIFEILLIATCIGFAIYDVIIGEFGSFILNIILATINCLTLVVFLALKD